MIRSRVDLPQPDGPIRLTKAPAGTTRSTWSRATTASAPVPNVLPTPASSTTGGPLRSDPTARGSAAAIGDYALTAWSAMSRAPIDDVEAFVELRPR